MKILIELPTWIGDTVMATPAIENIVSHYDDPEITILGSSASTELMRNHPKVVKIKLIRKNYISLLRVSKKLGDFDVFFSFRSSFRSKILSLLISSKNKYQINIGNYKNCHQVEKYNQFLNNSLKTNFIAGKLTIFQSFNNSIAKSKRFPIMGINPGASYGDAKRWHSKEFAEVAIKLSVEYDILIFGGQNEKDIASEIEKILLKAGVSNYTNLSGKTSISELLVNISNLDLLITGDSGPMHIAAGFQIPTISIFGPTKDNETSQWMNENSIILKKSLECQPCMKRTCPLRHNNCMKLIKAKDVLEAVELF